MSSLATRDAVTAMGRPSESATGGPRGVRIVLVAATLLFLGLFLVLPLVAVFAQGLSRGVAAYVEAVTERETLLALRLSLVATGASVAINVVFGLAASWAITRFSFRGKSLLVTLIDLPLAVSPVVAGLVFVLLFGRQGWLGPWLSAHGVTIIFATPGILLATVFVTLPLVVREVMPVMAASGTEEEEAARLLGASGWQVFFRVTLPNVKWGVLYGVILCAARAMGEFGAVSVVSGHVRGLTNTLPLHVEILYDEYRFQAAFAAASVLTLLALLTLVARSLVEGRARKVGR